MALPEQLHEKYLIRFDELIAEAEGVRASTREVVIEDDLYALGFSDGPTTYHEIDEDRFHEWQAKVATLLGQILPAGHPKRDDIMQMTTAASSVLGELLSNLKAVKNDYESGFLDDLALLVHAEVAGDYLAQAETLPGEGYHVPAAVLAGAVLEDALRKLCGEKGIPITKPSGERRGINAMNDDLAKAKVYNAPKAHEIRAWADIRNDCAHGDGDKVEPEDVERMVKGVRAFVADHLR